MTATSTVGTAPRFLSTRSGNPISQSTSPRSKRLRCRFEIRLELSGLVDERVLPLGLVVRALGAGRHHDAPNLKVLVAIRNVHHIVGEGRTPRRRRARTAISETTRPRSEDVEGQRLVSVSFGRRQYTATAGAACSPPRTD